MLELKEKLKQINIQNAIKGVIQTGLSDILQSLNKERLSALASFYELPGRSKMKKQELVHELFGYITDIQSLEDALLIVTPEEWEFFNKLYHNPFVQDN